MSDPGRVRQAAEVLEGVVRRTPILSSPFLDDIAGRRVLVKAECLQHTGSFKARGSWFAISQLSEAERTRGVIAFSSGNHAQGVAHAARAAGIPAVIVMPSDAPALKIANTKALGAEVVEYERGSEDRDAIGARLAEERGLTLVKPFDNADVIAGQGTVGLEIAQDAGVDDADVLVCCGGGGLTAGVSLGLDGTALRARPVEPEGFDDVARSLRSGGIERNNRLSGSLCDAIITPSPGKLTFPIMQERCGPGLVVTEEEALRAMAHAFLRLKVVLEPGGAVSLAAALFHPEEIEGDTVICVATGGNVDAPVFRKALDTL
ncbi:threonine ammonia-lyase [Pontivivens ytuae]|uniref:Threonine/serine dehydratase n=1 Tax=Pontivivens ytuae TaxID=2789856 RepID=A0A7S9QEG9_9RHOB|nr:threonine/serine dehydratase [Pontivivens ytuae]QPH55191.1 threonine/serine dehydratase [Pontivivens ytuae]